MVHIFSFFFCFSSLLKQIKTKLVLITCDVVFVNLQLDFWYYKREKQHPGKFPETALAFCLRFLLTFCYNPVIIYLEQVSRNWDIRKLKNSPDLFRTIIVCLKIKRRKRMRFSLMSIRTHEEFLKKFTN